MEGSVHSPEPDVGISDDVLNLPDVIGPHNAEGILDSDIFDDDDDDFTNERSSILQTCELGGKPHDDGVIGYDQNGIPVVVLVGSGEPCEHGGKIIKVGSCDDRHAEADHPIRKWCDNRLCPTCWNNWALREIDKAWSKNAAYLDICEQSEADVQHDLYGGKVDEDRPRLEHPGGLYHVMFSPPQAWALERMKTKGGIKHLRTESNREMREAGLRAGTVVFHSHRETQRARKEWKEACKRGDKFAVERKGWWHWLRKMGLLENEEYVYLSPHTHGLGYGWLMPSDEYHEKTKGRNREGWVYKKIRWIDGEEDFKRCLYYLLSHAAVIGSANKFHSLTYVGELHNMSRKRYSKDEHDLQCPECEASVCEWTGWSQEKEYDHERGDEVYVHTWNPEDSKDPPMATMDVMTYIVEKWEYKLGIPGFVSKGEKKQYYPYYSIQEIGRNPLERKKRPPGGKPPERGVPDGWAYDHAHDVWLDENGNVRERDVIA